MWIWHTLTERCSRIKYGQWVFLLCQLGVFVYSVNVYITQERVRINNETDISPELLHINVNTIIIFATICDVNCGFHFENQQIMISSQYTIHLPPPLHSLCLLFPRFTMGMCMWMIASMSWKCHVLPNMIQYVVTHRDHTFWWHLLNRKLD